MQFSRAFFHTRILLSLVLFGLLAFTVGCDGAGGPGTSNVTPEKAPPGLSGEDQAKARANAYPTGAAAKDAGAKKK